MPGTDPQPGRALTIRAASYNIHACVGRDGAFSPDRVADVIHSLDADFVGLQELEDRDHEGATVAARLAERLDMHAYHGPTLKRGEHDFGNLLLSRFEAERIGHHDVSVHGREPRGIIDASFDIRGLRLKVIVTHFGLAAHERRRQLERLLPIVESGDADATLLLADFNEWRPGSRLHRSLRATFGSSSNPRTFPAWRPILPLDRVYVAPAELMEHCEAVRGGEAPSASDHLPVVATCRVSRRTD